MDKEIAKYNPLWLRYNYLDPEYPKKYAEHLEATIANCKMPILKMMVNTQYQFEAYIPIIARYRFEYKPSKYYGAPMNELTIYLK